MVYSDLMTNVITILGEEELWMDTLDGHLLAPEVSLTDQPPLLITLACSLHLLQ